MRLKTSIMCSFVGVAGLFGYFSLPKQNTLISQAPFSMPLGDATYRLQKTITNTPLPYTFCVLHENERTGTNTIKQFMREIGGQVWEIKGQGDRNVSFKILKKKFSFDPNRIFTDQGIANTMYMLSRSSPTSEAQSIVKNFANRITDSLFAKHNILVSVHNNTDKAYSALSHLPDSVNANGVRDIYINSARDADDFFYVTRRFDFNYFKMLGYNVILQDNRYIKDDGSLSVYCGKRRIRYINVEAQHYHYDEQLQMLYSVQNLLKDSGQPPLAMLKPAPPKSNEKADTTQKTPTPTVEPILDEMPEDLP